MGVTPLEPSALTRRVNTVSLAVYGAMTLLGIVEAATLKNVADNAGALTVVIFSGSLSIVIAHAWSHVVGHRLVKGLASTRDEVIDELRFAVAFLVPAGAAFATIIVTLPFDDFTTTVAATQAVLLGFLFVVGFVGARRTGASWGRSLAWGALDAGIGVLIVALKELLSLASFF